MKYQNISIHRVINKLFRKVILGIKLITIVVALVIFLRVFCFSSYVIPSYSMYPNLIDGDHIVVNKWLLGVRLYKSFDFSKGTKTRTLRLKGLKKVNRNDVLVFNFPYKEGYEKIKFTPNVFYVKRCIAVPGDAFYIENGIYKVRNIQSTLGCYQNQTDNWIRFNKEGSGSVDIAFPHDKTYNWTILDFGPLYIPGKGDQLKIDTLNVKLYRNLISYETGNDISIKEEKVYLGDEILTSYTFSQNYYFMAGDYVFDSQDSRYWGLLPEDHIVGKATIIWNSMESETKKFRWNRFLKSIN